MHNETTNQRHQRVHRYTGLKKAIYVKILSSKPICKLAQLFSKVFCTSNGLQFLLMAVLNLQMKREKEEKRQREYEAELEKSWDTLTEAPLVLYLIIVFSPLHNVHYTMFLEYCYAKKCRVLGWRAFHLRHTCNEENRGRVDATATGGSQLARLNDNISCTRQYACAISAIGQFLS